MADKILGAGEEDGAPARLMVDIRLQVEMRLGERERVACRACGTLTQDRKPYCVDHIEQMPYVGMLLSEMARREEASARERSEALARGAAAVDTSGDTAREILALVTLRSRHNCATPGRIACDLQASEELVQVYLRALERDGLIAMRLTTRKRLQAVPVAQGAA